ncbi:Dyp-type peroxidase [Actinospica sp.]|jgi:deferrochelatase/peroxidase EfeB|uniref:Dyp-type peroxidase n=1 Tax=Actinospica sp. TaxID=1872142 RepID=UPI002C97BA5F|nr:Dyp-type peroxidase [Actinospica sp.]HWG24704.1 Dyp-type peroxidase [Actinospica sp.]
MSESENIDAATAPPETPEPTQTAVPETGSCPFSGATADGAGLVDSATLHAALRRRSFLRGAAVGAAGAVAVGAGVAGATVATADDGSSTGSGRLIPFHGANQSGILTKPQAFATFVSFNATAKSRADLIDLFKTITTRARFLTAGGTPADLGLASPPSDSETLGPVVPADGLTITLGVGASLFDDRYGLSSRKPARLSKMPVFPNDDMVDSTELHGDISLQICADHQDTVMHALRDIAKHTRGAMQGNWKIDGFQAVPRPSGTQRNQLGFKDGIANPDVNDDSSTSALIWAHGGLRGEQQWAGGGSYQVIRIIRMLVEFWDRVSLNEQELMIGRRRETGAPLSGTGEFDTPEYTSDPMGNVIPLDAHIRLANPRTKASYDQQILRRGYNYDRGFDVDGNLNVGLAFCCYQQDVVRQFEAVQTRLIDEPLVDYISPTGGGYFFALPGVRNSADYFGSGMFA